MGATMDFGLEVLAGQRSPGCGQSFEDRRRDDCFDEIEGMILAIPTALVFEVSPRLASQNLRQY
jgi:hypothetical protein